MDGLIFITFLEICESNKVSDKPITILFQVFFCNMYLISFDIYISIYNAFQTFFRELTISSKILIASLTFRRCEIGLIRVSLL